MTFTQLRTFVAVAKHGSVTAAAEELMVSAPSVSAAVRQLERDLGVVLVQRVGRGIELTEAGATFAEYAARLLGLADQARRATVEAAGQRGTLHLAAVTTAGEYVLPPLLARFRERYPDVEVVVEVGNRAAVLAALLHRRADLAIGGRPTHPDVEGTAFAPNQLVVVAAATHPLADDREVPPARLASETWLLREEGSGTRETVMEFLAAAGVTPGRVMTLGSNAAIREAVAAGLGIALVHRELVAAEQDPRRLVELRVTGTPLERQWYLWWRRDGAIPRAADSFRELVLGDRVRSGGRAGRGTRRRGG